MEESLAKDIIGFRDSLGFELRKRHTPFEAGQPHDETISMALCQRFYGKDEELKKATEEAERIFSLLLAEHMATKRENLLPYLELFSEVLGDMHYTAGEFKAAAECFMKTLSYNRRDITPWVELLFSLRCMGEFRLFERGIFNLEKLCRLWQNSKSSELNFDRLGVLIENAGDTGYFIVSINHLCNADCRFCADPKEIRKIADGDYGAMIQEMVAARQRFEKMIISGGEPTIYPRIEEYIAAARNAGYKSISLTTNGILLASGDLTGRLAAAGVTRFLISFQTTDSDDYDRITGVKGSYALVVKGIENVRKAGAVFNSNTVIHKLNYSRLEDISLFLIKNGVSNINLAFMNPIGSSVVEGKSDMAVSYTKALPFVQKAFEAADNERFMRLYMENVPLCMVPKLISRVSDQRQPEGNKDYYTAGKAKPEKCGLCRYDRTCDGTWKAYLEQFGDEELVPVR